MEPWWELSSLPCPGLLCLHIFPAAEQFFSLLWRCSRLWWPAQKAENSWTQTPQLHVQMWIKPEAKHCPSLNVNGFRAFILESLSLLPSAGFVLPQDSVHPEFKKRKSESLRSVIFGCFSFHYCLQQGFLYQFLDHQTLPV